MPPSAVTSASASAQVTQRWDSSPSKASSTQPPGSATPLSPSPDAPPSSLSCVSGNVPIAMSPQPVPAQRAVTSAANEGDLESTTHHRTAGRTRGPNSGNQTGVVTQAELELLKTALAGDRDARRRLADRLLDEIQREVAYCLMRAARPSGRDPRQEVRDIVHDVLVMLFDNDARELRRWDPDRGRSLDSFVRLLARRRAVRILGRRRTDPWKEPPVGPEVVDAEPDEVLVERLEGRAQLGEVLHALHDKMERARPRAVRDVVRRGA